MKYILKFWSGDIGDRLPAQRPTVVEHEIIQFDSTTEHIYYSLSICRRLKYFCRKYPSFNKEYHTKIFNENEISSTI